MLRESTRLKDKYNYIPPTYRSVKDSHDAASEQFAEIRRRNGRIEIEDLLIFAESMTNHLSEKERRVIDHLLESTMLDVISLLKKHPESEELIMGSALSLTLAGVLAVEDLIFKSSQSELQKARPFLVANRQKTIVAERARAIAGDVWQADTAHEYRVSEVAVMVRDTLELEGITDLPAIERVREWIRPIAPPHARLGGRPSKTL